MQAISWLSFVMPTDLLVPPEMEHDLILSGLGKPCLSSLRETLLLQSAQGLILALGEFLEVVGGHQGAPASAVPGWKDLRL